MTTNEFAERFPDGLDISNLAGADLTETDLRDANLTGADLTGARWNEYTIWPDGFDAGGTK